MAGSLTGCLTAFYLGLLFLGGGVAAAAQDDGVHVDPNSPAGKEYALPLDSARRDANGGGDSAAGSGAPLFGVGISRQGGSSSKSSAGNGRAQSDASSRPISH